MKRLFSLLGGVAWMALVAVPAAAQDLAPGRIPTVTRLVRIFAGLENSLNEAVRRHDQLGLARLLAEDFEMRSGTRPGQPVPRAEWLQALERNPSALPAPEQMAARDMGSVVLVSYLGRRAEGGNLFVVDAWRPEGSDWKLAGRYAAPAGDGRTAIPGDIADTGVLKKKAE